MVGVAPTVTVVTPALNAARVLGRCVRSVQAQDMRDWEMVIVNDGSSDATRDIVEALAADEPRIRAIHLPVRAGAAAARNAALDVARGRYIAFLDADDAWMPHKLSTQITAMQRSRIPFVFAAYLMGNEAEGWRTIEVPETVTRARLRRGNVIGCLTVMYDRDHFADLRFPLLRKRQDFAMWLCALGRIPQGLGLCEPLAYYYREQGVQTLSTGVLSNARATYRVLHQQEGLSSLRAAGCLVSHLTGRFRAQRGKKETWPAPVEGR